MSNSIKVALIIGCAILLSSLMYYKVITEPKAISQDTVLVNLKIKDSIASLTNLKLKSEIDSITKLLQNPENVKTKLKNKYIEKANSITNLGTDATIEYLSVRLSKKDSIK